MHCYPAISQCIMSALIQTRMFFNRLLGDALVPASSPEALKFLQQVRKKSAPILCIKRRGMLGTIFVRPTE